MAHNQSMSFHRANPSFFPLIAGNEMTLAESAKKKFKALVANDDMFTQMIIVKML